MQRCEMLPGLLRIVDEELNLDIADHFAQEEFFLKKEEKEGKVLSMTSYLGEELHGPSLFYNEIGTLLSSSWFCRGVREGRLRQYYPTGVVYAVQGFVHGLKEGPQRYYYPSGVPRTLIHCKMGMLEGEMVLYWPNGKVKRQLKFVEGRKQDLEQFWSEEGSLNKEFFHVQ